MLTFLARPRRRIARSRRRAERLAATLAAAALLAPTLPAAGVAAQEGDAGADDVPADSTAVLYGTVREAGTGRTLAEAEVEVLGRGRTTLTDSTGGYRIGGLAPGQDSVRVKYLNGQSRPEFVWLDPGGVTRLDLELRPEAVEVAELEVEVEGIRDRRMREIRERERRFSGQVVTPEELEEHAPMRTTDALRRIPGVRVRYVPPRRRGPFTPDYIVLLRGPSGFSGRCRPQLYLDGAPVQGMSVNDFEPEEILALEVYQGGEAPARFTSTRGCGAIAIWLRHGAD